MRIILSVFISGFFLITNCFASVTSDGATQSMQNAAGGSSANIAGLKQLTLAAWILMPTNGLPFNYPNPDNSGYFYGRVMGDIDNSDYQNFNFLIQDCGRPALGGTAGMLCAALNIDNNSAGGYYSFTMKNSTVPLYGVKHEVMIVWNNTAGNINDFTFYIDHVAQNNTNATIITTGTAYSTSTAIQNTQQQVLLGATNGEGAPKTWMLGAYSDVAVWSTALSSSNETTYWNNGVPAPCQRIPSSIQASNLIMYFPLDDQKTGTVTSAPIQLGTGTYTINSITGSPPWSAALTCSNGTSVSNIQFAGSGVAR